MPRWRWTPPWRQCWVTGASGTGQPARITSAKREFFYFVPKNLLRATIIRWAISLPKEAGQGGETFVVDNFEIKFLFSRFFYFLGGAGGSPWLALSASKWTMRSLCFLYFHHLLFDLLFTIYYLLLVWWRVGCVTYNMLSTVPKPRIEVVHLIQATRIFAPFARVV